MINKILSMLPHKHEILTKEGVGQIHICSSFRRTLAMGFSRDSESPTWKVETRHFQDLTKACSFEEAMAIIRRADAG